MLGPSSPPAPSSPPVTSGDGLQPGGGVQEQVEVRTEPVDGVATPAQLLRAGRLWLVRSARPLPGPGGRWGVLAAPGMGVRAVTLELTDHGGRWSLVAAVGDAAGTGTR